MQVDGYLHLFTTLFGWHYYGVLWAVLTGTGLVFLPFVGIVFDHLSATRSRGSLMNADPESALSGLEVQIFTAMIVILIAAVPTSFTTLNPSTLNFSKQATVHDDARINANIADAQSTWDEAVARPAGSTGPNEYGPTTAVSVPAWWFLVMQISQGIKYALIDNIDTRGEAFRSLRRIADTSSISNPELRWHVNTFYTHCYSPAVDEYSRQNLRQPFVEDIPATATTQGPDINWIGSKYFNDTPGYYDSIQVQTLVKGTTFDATKNPEYVSAPDAGSPMCNEYWTQISDGIYQQARVDGVVGIFQRSQVWFAGMFSDEGSAEAKSEVAQMYLHNTPKELTLTSDQHVALKNGGDGFFTNLARTTGTLAQSYELTKAALLIEMGMDSLIHALSIGQAYILMAIYILLPIGLLVSRFSIAYLMQAGLLIFAVTFWSVMWALAAWLDNVMASAIYQGQSVVGTLWSSGTEAYNKRLIHAISIGALYILGPVAVSWILATAGSTAGYIAGSATMHAGGGIAGAKAVSATNAARLGPLARGAANARDYRKGVAKRTKARMNS